jgi:hypothetical protein
MHMPHSPMGCGSTNIEAQHKLQCRGTAGFVWLFHLWQSWPCGRRPLQNFKFMLLVLV